MTDILVDTHGFWERMCDPAFIRLSLHTGKIGSTLYHTDTPPEMVPGFLEDKIERVKTSFLRKLGKNLGVDLGHLKK